MEKFLTFPSSVCQKSSASIFLSLPIPSDSKRCMPRMLFHHIYIHDLLPHSSKLSPVKWAWAYSTTSETAFSYSCIPLHCFVFCHTTCHPLLYSIFFLSLLAVPWYMEFLGSISDQIPVADATYATARSFNTMPGQGWNLHPGATDTTNPLGATAGIPYFIF